MAPAASRHIWLGPRTSPWDDIMRGAEQGFWEGVAQLKQLADLGTDVGEGLAARARRTLDHLDRDGWQVEMMRSLRQWCESCGDLEIFNKFSDRPLSSVFPMLMVGTIIGILYVAYTSFYLPLAGLSALSMSSLVFHTAVAMAFISYYKGVCSDPGKVPQGFNGEGCFEKKRHGGGFRYCNKENVYKPDRAHYCSALCRNVLKMDHYCPWLMNCVGHYNHKFFLLFLFYTVFATNMFCFDVGHLLFNGTYPAGSTFLLMEGEFIGLVLSSCLTPFFMFHSWLMCKNMTTIEFCEKMGGDHHFKSPYDLGLYANIKDALGPNPWLWLSPWHPLVSGGIQFKRRPEVIPEDTDSLQNECPEDTMHESLQHSLRHKAHGARLCLDDFMTDLVEYSCLYNTTMMDMGNRIHRICAFDEVPASQTLSEIGGGIQRMCSFSWA